MAVIETERTPLLREPTEDAWQQAVEALFEDVTLWAQEWLGEGGAVSVSEGTLTVSLPPRAGMLSP